MTGESLRNDCFALPPGITWTPVADALNRLKSRLHPVVGRESLAIEACAGRILAQPVIAARAHPPFANAAVDGYGFDTDALEDGPATLPLTPGRAAAGQPFAGHVPPGHALRILTGAQIPPGVTAVALQEDVSVTDTHVHVPGRLKSGANCRPMGEDMTEGAEILPAGRKLTAADIATAISAGVATAQVHHRLRVAVLSTGDEVVPAGTTAKPGQIFDANRPMLSAILSDWGYEVVDMGQVPDDPARVADTLSQAASRADAILTTGGASAGDEDHVSAALRGGDTLNLWRIAIKPGRPLALAMWDGTPVFGLPGNPVAAFVCTLVFARPALGRMAGSPWSVPDGFTLPAGFSKSKKQGRMEYLRARIEDGTATVFQSEGSGRISGLTWATGLVELDDPAQSITPGTPVRYIPFSAYGLRI